MQKEREKKPGGAGYGALLHRLRTDKRFELAVYAVIAVVVLLLYVSGMKKKEPAPETSPNIAQQQTAGSDTEARLKAVLSCIRGAGEVEVMITYDTGREIVTAMTKNTNTSSSESRSGSDTSQSSQTNETSQPATYNGADGNEPIVLYEREPIIRGVIVVAEGAADVSVRLDLQRAVRAVLDVPLSAIEVFERTGDSRNQDEGG